MERERRLLSCLRREGLGEPEELLELELREELELPERLDAEEELEPLLEPVLVLEPELELELERDLRQDTKGHRRNRRELLLHQTPGVCTLALSRLGEAPPAQAPGGRQRDPATFRLHRSLSR